jgi:tetratricopeptide (TPR) repeat protein
MGKRRSGDPAFEIGFYEKVLENSPNFIEALSALGDLYTREGFYDKGLKVDERLARLRPDDAVVLYNLACSYSLLNDLPRAREAMARAIARGYDDWDHLERDQDLENLRSDGEFAEYFRGLRQLRPGQT